MKTILLLLFLVCGTFVSRAQHFKLEHGPVISEYDNVNNWEIWYGMAPSHAVQLGMDYLERRWFYLSTRLGYARLGGAEYNPFLDIGPRKDLQSYLLSSTSFRAVRTDNRISVFLGLGPYWNVLLSDGRIKEGTMHGVLQAKSHGGALGELGFYSDIKKLRLGMSAEYRYSLTPAGSNELVNLQNRSLGVMASIGFRLK